MHTVLITGGAGFLGRNLARRLSDEGYRVRVLDNLAVRPVVPIPPDLLVHDVRDLSPADLRDVHTILHLAALKSVPESFAKEHNLTHNLHIDHHLLRVFADSSATRLILAGSCEVYGGQTRPNAERDPLSPRSPYAVGKAATEMLASVYRILAPAKQITVWRLFNIYGPDEGADAVVPCFVDALLDGHSCPVEGDGSQSRDFSHVDDAIEMMMRVVRDPNPPAVVNIGSGRAVSIMDVANVAAAAAGGGGIEWCPGRFNEIDGFIADTTEFEKRYGRVVRRELTVGIDDVLRRRPSLLQSFNESLR